jgi:hypothetical protein
MADPVKRAVRDTAIGLAIVALAVLAALLVAVSPPS